jgi:tRNA G18 (ribose-2'-O)-methylase SpoU
VHKSPRDFLLFVKDNPGKIVSAELCDGAFSIYDYKFAGEGHTYIVAGHETTGVPSEILINSDKVFIPMSGVGYCLNTSQAANVMLYEWSRQRNT